MRPTAAKHIGFPILLFASALTIASAQTLYVPSGTGGIGTSSNGNVGIGNSSPAEKLHVKGNVVFESANTSVFRIVPEPSINDRILQFENGSSASTGGFAFKATDGVFNAVRLKINNNGNVGIGTPAPEALLHVYGTAKRLALSDYALPTSGEEFGLFTVKVSTAASAWAGSIVSYGANGKGLRVYNNGGAGNTAFEVVQGGGSRFIVDGNGFVGVGTVSPAAPLEVRRAGGAGAVQVSIDNVLGGMTRDAILTIRPDSASDYGGFLFRTHNGGSGDFNALAINPAGNVGIGTITPSQKLSVNGTIRAKEVIVEASPWPDDVFEEGYKLKALSEVAAYIEAEGHLPDVANAATVAEQGVAVGEMQKTLLRKVEELTLYVIAQQKETADLRVEISQQADRIARLEAENTQLRPKAATP